MNSDPSSESGATPIPIIGGTGALGFLVTLAALIVVGIALVVPIGVIVVIVALAWLAVSRRRRAQRKHAGLRVLR